MTLNFKLEKNDFLQYQLFYSSTSERLKRQRKKTWVIYTFFCFALAGAFYYVGEGHRGNYIALTFIFTGIIFLFRHPSTEKNERVKNYLKFIDDAFKYKFGKEIQLSFTSDKIEGKDETSESSYRLTNIQNITEVPGYFYIKMLTAEIFIIPKHGISDPEGLRNELKEICARLQVAFISDLTWKFK